MSRMKRIKTNNKKVVESQISFNEFESLRCSHCGGAHLRACPRVKRMLFHATGSLNEIEFWQDGQWDTSNVLWPESIVESGEN